MAEPAQISMMSFDIQELQQSVRELERCMGDLQTQVCRAQHHNPQRQQEPGLQFQKHERDEEAEENNEPEP
eukprot:CAMPEP_0194521848 /NCGR_PEP_ID=MMETSP0253-20130528/56269_1 /TAXON_ID=2966 /ORGANISM="Noctiluca scintillans" /LENGTH=70 /DNA_ID=CAMNT_0039366231 /DNA_START=5 /DNA_END=213 /DNA_ORIENTATION=+